MQVRRDVWLAVLGGVAAAVTGVIVALAAAYVWGETEQWRCASTLGRLGQELGQKSGQGLYDEIDGERYFRPGGEAAAIFADEGRMCPACDAPFTYAPVTSSGERVVFEGNGNQLVAWAPCSDASGYRNVLRNDLAVRRVHDDEIAWHYQQAMDALEDWEREVELWRREEGELPP